MLRECDLNEISDGKKYQINDMVKADCDDCKGCSACCHGMGSSITLDPLDVHRITNRLQVGFNELLEDKIELNIVDGVILPNLKMNDKRVGDPCVFLDDNGRCSIHSDRPGICRIFPLGRVYEDGGFYYILQIHECKNDKRYKVKVSKWIDTPDLKKNQYFISDWHYFLKAVQKRLADSGDDQFIKQVTMHLLNHFYMEPYPADKDFYEEFHQRLNQAKRLYGLGG